jgi:hypothetical protein
MSDFQEELLTSILDQNPDLSLEEYEAAMEYVSDLEDSLRRGLQDSAEGRVHDLGDFSGYDAPVEWNDEDLDMNE